MGLSGDMSVSLMIMHIVWLICIGAYLSAGVYSESGSGLSAVTENSNVCTNDACLKERITSITGINGSKPNRVKLYDHSVMSSETDSMKKSSSRPNSGHRSSKKVIWIKNLENEIEQGPHVELKTTTTTTTTTAAAKLSETSENATHTTTTITTVKPVGMDNDTQTSHTGDETIPTSTEPVAVNTTSIPASPASKNVSSPDPSTYFNLTQQVGVCFCDLTANVCDVNCCCDEDCTPNDWKVFVRCIDDNQVDYSGMNCFKRRFIFKNNMKVNVAESDRGLFCIAKDNLKPELKYKTKDIINNLERFNKTLPRRVYSFSMRKMSTHHRIKLKNYRAGDFILTLQNGHLKFFGIPGQQVGTTCTSQISVQYLVDVTTECYYHELECLNPNKKNLFDHLKNLKVVPNPSQMNISANVEKVCQNGTCIGADVHVCPSSGNCRLATEETRHFDKLTCWDIAPAVEYKVWHNGSEGIKKLDVFIRERDGEASELGGRVSQVTTVKFLWLSTSTSSSAGTTFKRSGSPGYLTGKPILAGKKVVVNETASGRRERIELSRNPDDWLTVLGSDAGLCSRTRRLPVNFRENGQYTCSLMLTPLNFTKSACPELQIEIFKLLVGDDVVVVTAASNVTGDNQYNRFVAPFGNSRTDDPGSWLRVLMDPFPVSAGQIDFRSGPSSRVCKNVISDLYVEVAYSSVGSVESPQSKILGVSYLFGQHGDFHFYCRDSDCQTASGQVQPFRLFTSVHFVDVTEPAGDAFAEPLGLDIKLPHDFFYPFFSGASVPGRLASRFALFLVVVVFSQVLT